MKLFAAAATFLLGVYLGGGEAQARSDELTTVASQSCPCSGSKVCVGPRGGRYCITSGGNKRYLK